MATYDVQAILNNQSNLPEDQAVNTLHFEVNAPDTLNGLADDIAAAYQVLNAQLSSLVNGLTVKIYESGPNPAGPVYVEDYPALTGGINAGPPEVAICLSYATVDSPDASTPRRRGRIYVGPWAASVTATHIVDASRRDFVLDLGEALASAGSAGNTTWLMYSQTDDVYETIESIWCDDAWDTQRRRGYAPTLRDIRDVQ